jgi:predicted lipid-binding transport protein (Tim44 family)
MERTGRADRRRRHATPGRPVGRRVCGGVLVILGAALAAGTVLLTVLLFFSDYGGAIRGLGLLLTIAFLLLWSGTRLLTPKRDSSPRQAAASAATRYQEAVRALKAYESKLEADLAARNAEPARAESREGPPPPQPPGDGPRPAGQPPAGPGHLPGEEDRHGAP